MAPCAPAGRAALVECALARTGRRRRRHARRRHRGRRAIARTRRGARRPSSAGCGCCPTAARARRPRNPRRPITSCSSTSTMRPCGSAGRAAGRGVGRAVGDGRRAVHGPRRLMAGRRCAMIAVSASTHWNNPPCKYWSMPTRVPPSSRTCCFAPRVVPKFCVTLVANQFLRTPPSPFIKAVQVPAGFDVADARIVELVEAGDLVITADIPLAAAVLDKGRACARPTRQLVQPRKHRGTPVDARDDGSVAQRGHRHGRPGAVQRTRRQGVCRAVRPVPGATGQALRVCRGRRVS